MTTSENPLVALQSGWDLEQSGNMSLYYGTRDGLVQELTYNAAMKRWQQGFSFAMSNGNSGIDLRVRDAIHRYMICLNSAYQLEIWWKDFNDSAVASSTHPVRL